MHSRFAFTRLMNKPINDALCIVTECLHPTPMDNFLYLSRHPTELRLQKAVLYLARHAEEPEHLLHKRLLSSLDVRLQQLKSIHPFVPAALKLPNNLFHSGTSVARWGNIGETNQKTPHDSIHFISILILLTRKKATEALHIEQAITCFWKCQDIFFLAGTVTMHNFLCML